MSLAASPRASLARLALVLAPISFAAAAPALAADPFTLIVVPDTQNYADFDDINEEYNIAQMNWIADRYKNNTGNLNVKFVMHMGDLQNPGNPYYAQSAATGSIYEPDTDRPIGDVSDTNAKWKRADLAIDVLDANKVPYSLVPGNHDYLDHNTKSEPWKYLKLFGPQRYVNAQASWSPSKKTYGGASPAPTVNDYAGMNTYHRFDAGGYKFLNLALQYDPDDNDLKWAQQIINENPGLPTIITTHAYVNTVSQEGSGNSYQHDAIFDKLVKNNPQIVMTFNGHLTGANYVEGTNIAGKKVHQMLFDAQASDLNTQLGGPYYRGGGVLRMAQFDPDNNSVLIKDYSPIANKYLPSTFTAPDRIGTGSARYETPASLTLDLDAQFGLADKAGIVKSTSFRQGINGYNSNGDTYIDQNAPTTNFGSASVIMVDGDSNDGTSGSPDAQAMIRFQNIFGNGAGQIPLGAQIESATLILHTNDSDLAASGNTISLHRLLQNWNSTAAVWNTFNGFNADGTEAILGANGEVEPTLRDGYVSFDVTESLYVMSQGGTNFGWVLRPGGGNEWLFDSAEAADILDRPQLNVTFRVVPEPTSIASLAGVVALGLLRRRARSA